MATLKELEEEVEPYRNTLVIDGWGHVVRLVAVIDGTDDYYWVYDTNNQGIYHASCVGFWVPLKGYIQQDKYDIMVRVWNLNNIDKVV